MLEYMIAQRKKIEIEKWFEGIRRKSDPGNDYVFWWIQNYAEWFRNAWKMSSCCECVEVRKCGYNVKKECEKFMPNY